MSRFEYKQNFIRFIGDIEPTKDSKPRVGDCWYNTNLNKVCTYLPNNTWDCLSVYNSTGIVAGGYSAKSSIENIIFPFDSGTAPISWYLATARTIPTPCSSSQFGFFCGGGINPTYYSTIDRIDYNVKNTTATIITYLSQAKRIGGGVNSSCCGYFAGEQLGTTFYSTISKITFPFDSGIPLSTSKLTIARRDCIGVQSSQFGFFCGGVSTQSYSKIDRIIFSSDTGTASSVGNLIVPNCETANFESETNGFICGGNENNAGQYSSRITRFAFPFDSGTTSIVGSTASAARVTSYGCNASSYGYIAAGAVSNVPTIVSSVERITFPFDSGIASNSGNLAISVYNHTATDNTLF